jgi:hypothetical protein
MPDLPGCAATSGEIALPSRVSPVSNRAVEVVRFSSDGKALQPPISPALKVSDKMQNATLLPNRGAK